MDFKVIRLGHRRERDKRATTHCALVARALGASEMILCGEEDTALMERVRKVAREWGGNFYITYSPSWKKALSALKKQGYTIIHATMYGEPIEDIAPKLKRHKRIAIAVGGEKVPSEVYNEVNFNVSVTQQPHSEIAALAIILHELQNGKELKRKFSDAEIQITPQARGKKVSRKQARHF